MMEKTAGRRAGELGISVIGLGHWGPHYLRVLAQSPGSRLVLGCDQDSKRLADVSRLFGGLGFTGEIGEIWESKETEAVVIATPATTHYELTLTALEAGKDVLVEKPLAVDLGEALHLAEVARKNKRILMVGHTFLYNPGILKMKEILRQADFGEVYYLKAARTHLGLIREDVDVVWDLAPHDISIFTYLLESQPVGVNAVGACFLAEDRLDVGFVTLTYPNGAIANIQVSWIDSNKVRELVVVGSRQRMVFNDLDSLERVKVFEKGLSTAERSGDFGQFQLVLRDGDIVSPKVEATEPLRNMCSHFIDCVNSRAVPLTDGVFGAEVVAVIEAAQYSIEHDGCYVKLGEHERFERKADESPLR